MGELTDLGLKYHTDKAYEHKFTNIYESYFKEIKDSVENIFEIGVYKGASLFMWRDYFKNANIYGMDIMHTRLDADRIHTFKGRQENRKNLLNIMNKIGNSLDIIIDDGSHNVDDQQISLGILFPYLKSEGLYIIEDLHTSFTNQNERYHVKIDSSNTTFNILNNFVNNKVINSAYLSKEENQYLTDNIKECNFHIPTGDKTKSMICFIRKK